MTDSTRSMSDMTTPSASQSIPERRRSRYTTVTVWESGKPIATGTLVRKLKNGVRILGCHRGLGVEQDLTEEVYLDGKHTFTWE